MERQKYDIIDLVRWEPPELTHHSIQTKAGDMNEGTAASDNLQSVILIFTRWKLIQGQIGPSGGPVMVRGPYV